MNTLSKEIEEQFNFILQKHKWRLDSNYDLLFGLILDNNTGIKYFSNGDSMTITNKTSTEVVGVQSPENGGIIPNSSIPAKIIHAFNGDIVLNAEQGDIVLKGRNIRIEGVDGLGGEVTINSSKIVQISAPIVNAQSDKCTITGSISASIAGGSTETHGVIANDHSTGTDAIQASFFGQIISAIKRFKDFFDSICG
jgi:hypothetical protein